jgi:hypothetical protein
MNIALGNCGINLLNRILVSCLSSILISFFQSFIKLLSSGIYSGSKRLIDLSFLLRYQYALLSRLDIRQTIHLLDDT